MRFNISATQTIAFFSFLVFLFFSLVCLLCWQGDAARNLSFVFKRLYSPDVWRVSPNVEEVVPPVVRVKSPPKEGTVEDELGHESVRRSFEASSSKLATFSLTSLSIFLNVEPNGRDKIVKKTWRIFWNGGKNTARSRPRKFKWNFEKSLNEILKKFKWNFEKVSRKFWKNFKWNFKEKKFKKNFEIVKMKF